MVGLRHYAIRQGSNHGLPLRTLDDARLAFLRAADGEKDAGAQPSVAQSIHSVIERVAFFQCVPQQEGRAEIKSRQIGGRRPVDRDGISLRQHARQHTDVAAGADDHELPRSSPESKQPRRFGDARQRPIQRAEMDHAEAVDPANARRAAKKLRHT